MKKTMLILLVLLLTSCTATHVTLLPDAAGHVGAVIVENNGARPVTLNASGQTVGTSLLGERHSTLPPERASARLPALFAAEPAPVASQTVWFNHDAVTPLTDSRTIVRRVNADCQQREPCQITVIGHTDSVGADQYNMALSLRRAQRVRHLLIQGGFPPSSVDIRSHGPFDPLIKTASGKPQPKNRRVEIMVH